MILRDEVFPPFKRRVLESLAFAKARKKLADAHCIEECPTIKELQAAVKDTFVDFEIVYRHILEEGPDYEMPVRVKQFLNCCAVSSIFFNGYASRPGGWENMKADAVAKQLDQGLQFVVADDYKTVRKYGPKGIVFRYWFATCASPNAPLPRVVSSLVPYALYCLLSRSHF